MPKQRIIRSDGAVEDGFSKTCPKCCDVNIEKSLNPVHDFDETGWFNANTFTCLNPKCGHTWIEKQTVVQNGKFLK